MRKLIRNILGIMGVMAAILVAVLLYLHTFTRHNRSYPLPDFSRLTLAEAQEAARDLALVLEVQDSLFIPNFPKGCVFRQVPAAGQMVKKNRHVLLTLNSVLSRKVAMPNLVGYSLRQAKAVLASSGLEMGQLSYEPDLATNNVLGQNYRGIPIAPGTLIEAMSAIDLRLGKSGDAPQAYIPNLTGRTLLSAKDILADYSLNLGRVIYDKSIRTGADTLAAKVYSQTPSASGTPSCEMGTRVHISLTVDPARLGHDNK